MGIILFLLKLGIVVPETGNKSHKVIPENERDKRFTPHELIQNTKLKFAVKMLRDNPEYNNSDTAFNTGFSSLNYFGKSFKEFFGESPSVYKKIHGLTVIDK